MMSRRTSVWTAVTTGVAVIAGAVVFLALQGSADKADKWSSIGGFLTALVTVVVSGIAWSVRRDTDANTATPTTEGQRPIGRRWWAVLLGNGTVFIGDNQRNVYRGRDDD